MIERLQLYYPTTILFEDLAFHLDSLPTEWMNGIRYMQCLYFATGRYVGVQIGRKLCSILMNRIRHYINS